MRQFQLLLASPVPGIFLASVFGFSLLAACATPPPGSFNNSGQPHPKVVEHQAGCDRGRAADCAQLGYIYELGLYGIAVDHNRANHLYAGACDAQIGWACTNIGLSYESGRAVSQDSEIAAIYYQRGCELGSYTACSNLGMFYNHGIGVPRDLNASSRLFRLACDHDQSRGCSELGRLYQYGYGVETDTARAAALYEKACRLENAKGCTRLGWLYERGQGVEEDKPESFRLYTRGCELGDALGCNNAGLSSEFGRGTAVNFARAATYYERACNAGFARGCQRLGMLFRDGNGVEQDIDQAIELLNQACAGYPQACTTLGVLYQEGKLVEEDEVQANQLFTAACEGGDISGCRQLVLSPELPDWAGLLTRGCEAMKAFCHSAAGALIKRDHEGDALLARSLLETGCEARASESCQVLLGFRHVEFRDEYAEQCAGDDGLACLKLAAVDPEFAGYAQYCSEPARSLPATDGLAAACQEGDSQSCWLRGAHILSEQEKALILMGVVGGLGVGYGSLSSSEEPAVIEARYRAACDDDDVEACVDLARHLRTYNKDYEGALFYGEKACQLKNPRGCRDLANALLQPPEGEVDEATRGRAVALLDQACLDEDGPACTRRARILLEEDSPDQAHLFTLLDPACTRGSREACGMLEHYFENQDEGLHSSACYFHYVLEQCTPDSWFRCHSLGAN